MVKRVGREFHSLGAFQRPKRPVRNIQTIPSSVDIMKTLEEVMEMKGTVTYMCEKPERFYKLHEKIYYTLKGASLREDVLQKVMDELNDLSQQSFTEGVRAAVKITQAPVQVWDV